jgi:hypothetical protein
LFTIENQIQVQLAPDGTPLFDQQDDDELRALEEDIVTE